MCEEAHHRQNLRLAIDAAEFWGSQRPRRWVTRYGGLIIATGKEAPALNKEFIRHRKRIALLVPKAVGSLAW